VEEGAVGRHHKTNRIDYSVRFKVYAEERLVAQ